MIIRKKRLPNPSPISPRFEPTASSSPRRGGIWPKQSNRHQAFILWLLLFWGCSPLAYAAPEQEYIENGGFSLSLNGQVVAAHRPDELFIPASTIKLLTALAVFRHLGEDYRFTTSFFLGPQQVLYIRGSGDPFLTSEVLNEVAVELRARGINRINALVLDDSAFQLEHDLPDGSLNSINPYDTGNSALAVNFNTIALHKDQNGAVHPLEPQTPVLAISAEIGHNLGPGDHRLNSTAFPLAGNLPIPLRVTGELIGALLTRQGIQVKPSIRRGSIPAKSMAIATITSTKTAREMVMECLRYSNNYIANQLALTAGARRFGYPATWEKARQTLLELAGQLGIAKHEIELREGSGLSRRNLLTPTAMLKIVTAFVPWRSLLPEKHGALLKSGTMEGVFCYAGYVDLPTGTAQLVVMLNQETNHRDAVLTAMLNTLSQTGSDRLSP